jgi:hypothetical protein
MSDPGKFDRPPMPTSEEWEAWWSAARTQHLLRKAERSQKAELTDVPESMPAPLKARGGLMPSAAANKRPFAQSVIGAQGK